MVTPAALIQEIQDITRKSELIDKIVNWHRDAQAETDDEGSETGHVMDRRIERKRWTWRRLISFFVVGAFIAALLYQFLLGDHSSKLNVEARSIMISPVERGPFQEFIPVRGTVLPIQTIYLDAIEGGRVEQVLVEEGSVVQKGNPIVKLSNTNLRLNVMNQEALLFEQINNLRSTRVALEQRRLLQREKLLEVEYEIQQQRITYNRTAELKKRDLISEESFEKARENYEYLLRKKELMVETIRQDSLFNTVQIEQIGASIERMEANLKIAKQNLDNLVIKAPVTGQLTSLSAEVGESKSPGEHLGQIDVLEGYKIRASIDEFYIARINVGQSGTFDFDGEDYRLVIRKVYPEVRDGRFEVDLEFVGRTAEDIRRGQTLLIRLELGDLSEALLLPRGGFYQTTGGNWVFVVDPSGEFATRRKTRIGRQNPEYYEVVEGLRPGERVITSSYENFEKMDKLILKK